MIPFFSSLKTCFFAKNRPSWRHSFAMLLFFSPNDPRVVLSGFRSQIYEVRASADAFEPSSFRGGRGPPRVSLSYYFAIGPPPPTLSSGGRFRGLGERGVPSCPVSHLLMRPSHAFCFLHTGAPSAFDAEARLESVRFILRRSLPSHISLPGFYLFFPAMPQVCLTTAPRMARPLNLHTQGLAELDPATGAPNNLPPSDCRLTHLQNIRPPRSFSGGSPALSRTMGISSRPSPSSALERVAP